VREGGGKIEIMKMVKIVRDMNKQAVQSILEELENFPNKVIIGGPSNSLVVHGKGKG
jgi:tRNA(Ser,Leu) C12 N-acetylase TAN1